MSDDNASKTPDHLLEAYADRLWESVETHQLSDMALGALTDMVVDCTSAGRILRANRAFCNFSGLSAEQIEGRDGHEFAFLQGREKSRCTVELQSPEGETTWFDRIQFSMRDPQSGNRFIRIVGRDVTEHKLSEIQLIEARRRAEAADEAKSRFLAMVSHEIRTPLNGIIGMGKLLADTKLSPEQQSYVEAVTTSGEALLVLVNDLLHFGKQELTDDRSSPEPTDLRSLVAGVVELLAEQAHGKGIDLGYNFAPQVPPTNEIDAGRMRQMLFNIVGNAVKFTEQGGVRVDVNFSAPDKLKISVTDTGSGIDDDNLAKIFEPFERVENTFTRRYEGAGLGLAISRKIAKSMGGDINVASIVGRGSRFIIEIDAPASGTFEVEAISLKNDSVLLLCQQGVEVDILVDTMENAGALVTSVSNLDQAHAIMEKQGGPHKIIIDERLGQCRDALGASWPAGTRLIALIDPTSRKEIGAVYNAEGQSFLTRPVRPSTLLRVLSELEDNSETGTAAEDTEEPATLVTPEGGLNLLLAEDNPVNALLARKLLERNGHMVTWVENGADAVAAVKDGHDFDAALMDLHMPVMDGLSAIKAIRKLEEDAGSAQIPIFAVTADTLAESSEAVLAAGTTAILEKPLNIEALETLLDRRATFAA